MNKAGSLLLAMVAAAIVPACVVDPEDPTAARIDPTSAECTPSEYTWSSGDPQQPWYLLFFELCGRSAESIRPTEGGPALQIKNIVHPRGLTDITIRLPEGSLRTTWGFIEASATVLVSYEPIQGARLSVSAQGTTWWTPVVVHDGSKITINAMGARYRIIIDGTSYATNVTTPPPATPKHTFHFGLSYDLAPGEQFHPWGAGVYDVTFLPPPVHGGGDF